MGGRRWEAVRAKGQPTPAVESRSAAPSVPTTGGYSNRAMQRHVLRVRAADDGHERQADEVARSVAQGEVASPLPVTPARGGEAMNPALRRAVRTARGGGRPVPEQVRQPMEQALATDFGQVRVHTGRLADGLNRRLQARAFTTGRDIFVRGDEYAPNSHSGRELLAHELTHVAQQGGAPTGAVVQLKPRRKRGEKFHTDSNIPGATLELVEPDTDSESDDGGVRYYVNETKQSFYYYEDDDSYWVRGKRVKPISLAPEESSFEERSDDPPVKKKAPPPKKAAAPTSPKKRKKTSDSSGDTSEEVAKPKKKKLKEEVSKKKKKVAPKPAPKPKKKDKDKSKRRSAAYDPLFSDFSSSEDDDRVDLSAKEKFGILTSYGPYKHKALSELSLPKAGDVFLWNHPHSRKSFAAHRTTEDDPFASIDRLHTGKIGHQYLNVHGGRGHLIGGGGNQERRKPLGITEPPADYHEAFDTLKTLGKDENARALLTAAGDTSKIEGGKLSHRQVAAIVLYAMNNLVSTDLPSSQLTEALGKMLAIFMSESARAFEASGGLYDATLLIKASLQSVIEGKATLDDAFYRGPGGEESIFLGAPSKERSKNKIGGAAQLRSPLDHPDALRRQMDVFPTRKREFKRYIRRSKTGTKAMLPKASKQDLERAKAADTASQIEAAKVVLQAANSLSLPKQVKDLLEWGGASGAWGKAMKAAKAELRKCAGNDAATAIAKEAIEVLDAKKVKAGRQFFD